MRVNWIEVSDWRKRAKVGRDLRKFERNQRSFGIIDSKTGMWACNWAISSCLLKLRENSNYEFQIRIRNFVNSTLRALDSIFRNEIKIH